MLCNLYEDLMVKCDKYWPDEPGIVKIYNNEVEVEMISQVELMKGLIIERNFKVTLVNDQQKDYLSKILKESLIVSQYHVTCWPDHGIPNSDYSFNIITFLLKKIKENYNYSINNNILYSPTVVHCSAGIGRTGTFMAIYNIYDHLNAQLNNFKKSKKINSNNSSFVVSKGKDEQIMEQKVNTEQDIKRKSTTKVKFIDINSNSNVKEEIFFSVFSIVRKLREQRFMLVTDLVQYKFLYKFAYNWINYNFFNKKDISMDIELIDEEAFKKDYSYLKNELNMSETTEKKISNKKNNEFDFSKEPKLLKCHLPTSKNKNSKKIDFDYKENSSKIQFPDSMTKSSKNMNSKIMNFPNKKIDFDYSNEIIEENENSKNNSPEVNNNKRSGKEHYEEIEPFSLQTNIPPITPKVKNKMNLFLNMNDK